MEFELCGYYLLGNTQARTHELRRIVKHNT